MDKYINKIIHGDCLEVMKGMPDKCVDLIITDPPYGMNFQSNSRLVKHSKIEGDDRFPIEIFDELFRLAKRAIYVFCRWDNLHELPKPKSTIAWVKNNWSMGDLKHEHGRQWEAICFYPLEEHEFIKRIPDVIHADRTGNEIHPTQKPVHLIEEIIASNVGEIILDPFGGSCTTAVAASNLGRKYICIEKEEKYIKVCNDRINSLTQQLFNK